MHDVTISCGGPHIQIGIDNTLAMQSPTVPKEDLEKFIFVEEEYE